MLTKNKHLEGLSYDELKKVSNDLVYYQKYSLCLLYVNKILKNLGKGEIKSLLEFIDINSNDIIEHKDVYKSVSEEIYSVFDKKRCNYYNRESEKIVLNCLRGMCKELGLNLKIKKVTMSNGEGYFRTEYLYSIFGK